MIKHQLNDSDPDPRDHELIARADAAGNQTAPRDAVDEAEPKSTGGSLAAYLHAFRRRWFVAISLGLLCGAAAAAAVWVTNEEQFTALVRFRVAASPESLIFDSDRGRGGRDDYQIYKNTQQQLIRTDYVIKAALRPDNVNKLPIVREQEDPDRWLAEQIRTTFPNEGEVMAVSVTADTPQASAYLTASVSKAYLDEVVNEEKSNRLRRLSELQTTLNDKKAEREEKNAELRELARSLGSGDTKTLSNQQRVAQDHWMAVYREWIVVQNDVTRLKAEFEIKRNELQRAQEAEGDAAVALVSPFELESAKMQDAVLADLKLQVERRKETMQEVQRTTTATQLKQHEQRHTRSLEKLQKQIAIREQEIESHARKRSLARLGDQVAQLTSELETKQGLEKQLRAEEERLRDSVKEFGGSSLVVENLKKEIDSLDRLIEPMDRQARQLEIELERPNRVTRITRLESESRTGEPVPDNQLALDELAASIRPASSDPNSQLNRTAAAGIGAFGLVVVGILFLDVRTQRVNSSTDVSHSIGLPVVGAIPLVPDRAISSSGTRSKRYRRWRTLLNESMRGVMVRLVHDMPAGQSRVIFVSSACSGEGKSTLATNLGLAMARAGYRTLLIDFDLRRPSLDQLFDLPSEPGVAELLRSEATTDEAIRTVESGTLSVLPAGHWSPHHVSVLANGDTESVFAELRKKYQFIIADGAPILGVAESQLLSRHADTVLISVLRDVSSGPKILAACDTLANFGARSVYAVVTGTSSSDYGQYYSDYGSEDELADLDTRR